MNPLRQFHVAACIALTLLLGTTVSSQENRTWTSRNGKHTTVATLTDYDTQSKTVILLNQDGATIHVPLKKLSRSDQRFVKRAQSPKSVPNQSGKNDTAVDADEKKTSRKRFTRKRTANRSKSYDTELGYGIQWTPGMENALASAAGSVSSDDDRPVMWFRVLGDLKGYM